MADQLVLECDTCSAHFQYVSQNIATVLNIAPRYGNAWLFDKAWNVYWEEKTENPITMLMTAEGKSIRVTMTDVFCSGCGTDCGWKIISVDGHPVLREGQYIL